MQHTFHFNNCMAETGIYLALQKTLGPLTFPPVVLCIGSDLAVGDSLGPISGTMLLNRQNSFRGYVYGTLKSPITAKEARYIASFLRRTHPHTKIIAVDAAVGAECDVGLIKVVSGPIQPGAGVNKTLPAIGDVSILGIVAKKSPLTYALFNLTRMNVVYSMAEIITNSIQFLTNEICEKQSV